MLKTIKDLIEHIEKFPANPHALNCLEQNGVWRHLATNEYIHQSRCISAALKKMGLKKGDRVAIMSPPSHLWTICDLAIMGAGYVSVPIFHNISIDNFKFQIEQSEVKVIFASGTFSHEVCEINAHEFRHIISLDEDSCSTVEMPFKDMLKSGEEALKKDTVIDQDITPDDLASIVYTSGTTSHPKGVELTQRYMVVQIIPSSERVDLGPNDSHLHYLPLAHIAGRMTNISMLFHNVSIYYIKDPSQVLKACQEAHPTFIIFIPRLMEKLFFSIKAKIEESKWPKKQLALWAFELANRPKNFWSRLLTPIADFILYKKIRHLFGNKLRVVLFGSAMSNMRTLTFFQNAGIPLLEVYGLTEACPALSNAIHDNRLGTIGKPMPDVEVKLSEAGEILLRGPGVTKGYYKNLELTARAFDAEGWLHTRDRASVDSEGYYTFLGRLSEKCKTSYGQFVDIPSLEQLAHRLPFVDLAIVIADNKPYVTCLLFPDMAALEKVKNSKGLQDFTNEEIFKMDFFKREIDRSLKNLNQHLNEWERIKDYRFVSGTATVEGGELSPTLKPRRKFIEDKYKNYIAELYPIHLMQIDL